MIGTLLRKELLASKHRVAVLVVVLLVLPGAFAGATVFFQHVLPKDAPVAVVPEEGASEADREVVVAALQQFAVPRVYDDRDRAIAALRREQVYAVVSAPPGIADPNASRANVTIVIDGDMVPYREPSAALASVVRFTLNDAVAADVSVTREFLGEQRRLPSYLVPTFLMVLVLTYAFAYLPYDLAREEAVLDRLRVEASLSAALVGKLVFLGSLLVVPLLTFAVVSAALGHDGRVLAPGAVAAYLLTFVAAGSVSAAVTLLTRFDVAGRLVNVVVLFATMGFSGLVYPVGFFSPTRREVVRLVPTHYAVIVARSTTLKGADASAFGGWLAGLAGTAVVALVLLLAAVRYYEVRA